MHTLIQALEIFLGQRVIQIDIIVEAVVDYRADGHFGLWPQLLDGMPQQMGTGVTQNVYPFLILGGNDGDRCVGID